MNKSITRAYGLVYIGSNLKGYKLTRVVSDPDQSFYNGKRVKVREIYTIETATILGCCGALEISAYLDEDEPYRFFTFPLENESYLVAYHSYPSEGYFEIK